MKKNKDQVAYKLGWISVIINILLFIIKYIAGIYSASIALMADAWHTLSDSLTSIVMIVGIKIASKPADKEHPYGHGRAEFIATIIIGVFLGIIAYEFLIESIHNLKIKKEAKYGYWAIFVTLISIILKELLARVSILAGKRENISSLKADGWHHRSDAISSVIILLGIFLGKYFWWIDSLLGILVAIFIAYTAYEIIMEAAGTILGEAPEEELIQKIQAMVNGIAGFPVSIHKVHVHNYGSYSEVIIHIELPADWSLRQAHDVADTLEKQLKTQLNMESTIHMDPI
ncbi:MAG: cation transporter [Leptospiraceae bacterium]|nr:cation transporter [Leptospiraceae bacterium]MCP5500576.1 cation transporter [Leptospiraceae bacterium]